MACKESICRNCFHSYVCEQFNENKDDNNEKCHFANDHYISRTDVVPKSEVNNWYMLYHSIKEELKQEKIDHGETEKLCDRYCIESQQAKTYVARKIFEEIENKIEREARFYKTVYDQCLNEEWKNKAYGRVLAIGMIHDFIIELKKKYTEDKT